MVVPLPIIMAQKLERNERIASLLSCVFFRSIRPTFTDAIKRHPLSLWDLQESDCTKREAMTPIVIFLENRTCSDSLSAIAKTLKTATAQSGFMVAEIHGDLRREDVYSKFSSKSDIFLVDLRLEDALQVHARENVGVNNNKSITSPSLVLVSKGEGPNMYKPNVQCHLMDPHAVAVSLPDSLDSYGDGPRALWLSRTVLKWMKAIETTSDRPLQPLHSKL